MQGESSEGGRRIFFEYGGSFDESAAPFLIETFEKEVQRSERVWEKALCVRCFA